jgi:transposase
LYHGWARRLDVVLRHDHRAGEKMFVDYAGAKIPMYDRQTGEVVYQAAIFVAVLGASSYTFAEATQSQELSCWIGSQVRALEFLGGVPELWRARHKRVYVKDRIMRRKSSGNAKRVAVVHGSFA